MTLKKVWVKPKHGLILAGIPKTGAEVDGKLAKEWLDNDMVEEIPDPTAKEEKPASPEKEG